MEVILTLLSAGAEVDHADNDCWTALDVAAQWGHVETIHALLAAGAEVNHVNNAGETALYKAAEQGHVDAVRALLQAGADINRATNKSRTPLAAARGGGHEEAARVLLEAGAEEVDQEDVEEANKTPFPRIKEMREAKKNDATEGQQPAKVGFVGPTPDFNFDRLRSVY
mgnify:CR=1 FL=1